MPYIDLKAPSVIGKVVKNLNNRSYRIVDNVDRKASNGQDKPPVIALDLGNGDWERFYYDGKPERGDRSPLNLFEDASAAPTPSIKMIVGRTYITKNYIKVICTEFVSSPFSFSLFNSSYAPNTYRIQAVGTDGLGSTLFRKNWIVDENGVAAQQGGESILEVYTPSTPKYYWVYVPNTSDSNPGEPWRDLRQWLGPGTGSSIYPITYWTGFIDFNSRPSLYQTPQGYTLMQVAIQETCFDIEEFKLLSHSDRPAPTLVYAWTSPFTTLNIQGWTLQSAPVSKLSTPLNSLPVYSAPVHSVDKFIIAQAQYPFEVWISSINTLNCQFGYSDNGVDFKPIEDDKVTKFYWEYSLDGVNWTQYSNVDFFSTVPAEEEWSATKDYTISATRDYAIHPIVSYAGARFKALKNIKANPVFTNFDFLSGRSSPVHGAFKLASFLSIPFSANLPIGTLVEHLGINYVSLKEVTVSPFLEPINPSSDTTRWLPLPASPALDTARWGRESSPALIEKTVKAKFLRLVLKPKPSLIPSSPPTGTDRRYFAKLNSVEIKLIQS